MPSVVNGKILEIKGIDPKTIETMVNECTKASPEQKVANELYFLREQNEILGNQVKLLKDDNSRLKNTVEAAITIIVSTVYSNVEGEEKFKIDEFRKKAAQILALSDLIIAE